MSGTWGQYPCEVCGGMYDVRGQCDCEPEPIAVVVVKDKPFTLGLPRITKEKKAKPVPKVARGFKTLKGTTVGTVIADAVNQVTILAKDGKAYFVIEAEVINGIPVMKCKRHKVVKYKRPVTTGAKHVINKFGDK